jgi:hypothetical protein
MSSQRVSGTAVQRTIAVLGSAVFFVVVPFTLAGLVPWWITGWQLRPPFLGLELANDGQDTRAIQQYLGHRNIQHTTRYMDLAPNRFKDFWRD